MNSDKNTGGFVSRKQSADQLKNRRVGRPSGHIACIYSVSRSQNDDTETTILSEIDKLDGETLGNCVFEARTMWLVRIVIRLLAAALKHTKSLLYHGISTKMIVCKG